MTKRPDRRPGGASSRDRWCPKGRLVSLSGPTTGQPCCPCGTSYTSSPWRGTPLARSWTDLHDHRHAHPLISPVAVTGRQKFAAATSVIAVLVWGALLAVLWTDWWHVGSVDASFLALGALCLSLFAALLLVTSTGDKLIKAAGLVAVALLIAVPILGAMYAPPHLLFGSLGGALLSLCAGTCLTASRAARPR